ncbi:hypothetical protein KCU63_g23189, partial [Aureobasidium melanogenum]
QRKDHITSTDLNALKDTMEQWLSIIGDIGHLMGSGNKLQNAVRHIVNASIDNIHRHLAAKTASAAVASANIAHSSPALVDGQQDGVNGYNAPAGYAPAYVPADPNGAPPTDTTAGASYLGPDENGLQAQQSYQNNGFAYPDPSGASASAYPAFVDNSAYTNGDDIKSDLTAQLAAHNAGHALHQANHTHNQNVPQQMSSHDQTTQNLFQAFTSPSPNNSYASPTTTATTAAAMTPQQQPQQMMMGPVAWRHFTHDMLGIMGTGYPGFDVQNANALLALGQKPPGVEPSSVMPVGDGSGVPLPLIGD